MWGENKKWDKERITRFNEGQRKKNEIAKKIKEARKIERKGYGSTIEHQKLIDSIYGWDKK